MTTFHPIVLKCPQCGTLMNDYELMSYTIHDSTVYSDGNSDQHPMSKEISICAVCHLPFWRNDATLPEDPDWDTEGLSGPLNIFELPWRFDENARELTIEYYKDLLDKEFADDDEKEIYLRTKLWWSINNIIRNLPTWRRARNLKQLRGNINRRKKSLELFSKYKPLLDQNLDRMIFLYIKSAEADLLFLANMYREKGDFKKARVVLSKFEGKKGKAYRKIKRKIRQKVCHVIQTS